MDSESEMQFEWKHSRDDHQVMIEYHLNHSTQRKWVASAQRNMRLLIFGFVCIPLLIFFVAEYEKQSLASMIVFGVAVSFIFWVTVLKKPNAKAMRSNARRLARLYVEQMPVIPEGRHQLCSDGEVLEWHWVEGKERTSFPITSVERLVQNDGRLYFYRNGDVAASIPFHAFGDQQTRLDFIAYLERIAEKEFHV